MEETDKKEEIEKGTYQGNCNRTSCQKPPALYYNHSTRKYYCRDCADLINTANRQDALRIYGHDLCTLGQFNPQTNE